MKLALPWGSRLEAWGTSPGDVVLAVAVTVVVSSEFGPQWVAEPLVAGLVGVPVLMSLAWRRRFPVAVAVAVCAFGLLLAVTAPGEFAPQFYFLAVLIAVYSCAAETAGRQAVLGGAVTFTLITVAHVMTGDGDAGDFLPWLVWGAPWSAGRLVRRRTLEAAASGRRAAELERQRDAAVREAASRERDRIARELHDVVAHSVSVMVVQAGAERMALGHGHPRTTAALEAVENAGREALTELRSMLAVLRDGREEPPELAPQPDLDQVPTLVDQLRAAGLPVDLRVSGTPAPALPPGLGLSAYRIVQEALTNVLKHAPGARTHVDIRHTADALRLEVRNGAPRERGIRPVAGGRGLIGMRERVALHGGELEAGPHANGWRVAARLPVREPVLR
ncbi:sensor histidine kinase [Blastococcus montanus]|uniref:sensor histidine kinase n=1 Tax=Blastococcus montanus TaxID=3144973 RepID=UPI003207E38E